MTTIWLLFFVSAVFGALPQVAIAKEIDLTGTWTYEGDIFHGDNGCKPGLGGSAPPPKPKPFSMNHEGSTVTIPGDFGSWRSGGSQGYGSALQGEVRGNQFTLESTTPNGFRHLFEGNISSDGNTISGRMTCYHNSGPATATGDFTFTREGEDTYYLTL